MSIEKRNLVNQQDASIPFPSTHLDLGPSGFRDYAEKIPKIAYRVGVWVGNSVVSSDTAQYYVIMITASHNPKQYNGIKVSNREGSSLSDQESKKIQLFVNNQKQDWSQNICFDRAGHPESRVFLGMDKRQTSPNLYDLIIQALSHFKIKVLLFNNVTTPTLYSYCYSYIYGTNGIQKGTTAQQITEAYIKSSIDNFKTGASIVNWNQKPNVTLDCANGAVGIQIRSYIKLLQQYFDVNIINAEKFEEPNFQCGSDYVSTLQLLPLGIVALTSDKFVSFDGDGDRIVVYFKKSQEQPLLLFDGDRLNSILITTLSILLKKISIEYGLKLKIGCVCTIASNKGFIEYVKSLQIPLEVCKVGIKYLFEEARQYDIGALFEISGHGSFFVNQQTYQTLIGIKQKTQQLELLLCLLDLCNNNSRGDGFKNFLVLELCQKYLNLASTDLIFYQQYQFISSNLELKNLQKLKLKSPSMEIEGPVEIIQLIKEFNEKYPQVSIMLRKSSTQKKMLRIKLESKEKDQKTLRSIYETLKEALLLNKQLNM